MSKPVYLLLTGLLFLGLGFTSDHHQPEDGWISLFNGENFDGWEQKNGKAIYTVEDGVVVGTTVLEEPNAFMCTTRDYDDFVLEFEVMVDDELNSGVQIRSKSLPEYRNGRVHGPQVEIEAGPGEAGFIYHEGTDDGWLSDISEHDHFKNGEWNQYRIVAVGPTIKSYVNGMHIETLINDEVSQSGFIGLQVHSTQHPEPLQVRWRNIRLMEL